MGPSDKLWIVEVSEVYGGLVTLTSPHHQTSLTMATEEWIKLGRPGAVEISPQVFVNRY